jgi:hypothetical protein
VLTIRSPGDAGIVCPHMACLASLQDHANIASTSLTAAPRPHTPDVLIRLVAIFVDLYAVNLWIAGLHSYARA